MNDIKIYELQKTEYLKMPYMPISKRKELLTKLYDLVKNNEKKIMDPEFPSWSSFLLLFSVLFIYK
ncbi:hypothetical protein [Mycoplasmopsis adleri]|uniref:hypothetical protein n=1 Tax=Mycoplasmopsis adleri TaxID=51362 RepID=UPI0038732528